MNLRSSLCFATLVLSLATTGQVPAEAEDWPQFRGPQMNGSATSQLPLTWDSTTNVQWKVEVPGEGWSCPILWGDKLFLSTAVPTEDTSGVDSDDLVNLAYEWRVLCMDASTGEKLWERTARTGRPPLSRHSSNTFATETPVTDGENVYVYFGMTGLFCYSIDGDLQWEKELGSYEMRAGWGTSSSPILFGDNLYLQIDNEEQSFLLAIDKQTGEQKWRVDRDEPSQYSTPIIWKNGVRSELITGGQYCRSYDPETGELLWSLNMEKGRSSATPIAFGDRLYVGTELRNRGGDDDGGGYLFAIKPGGSGDITPNDDANSSSFVAWKVARAGLQAASPVVAAGQLFLLDRRSGQLHCLDAETGESNYRVRIPGARAFWSSPWTCSDRVYCLDDNGTTHVLAAGGEFQVLETNPLNEQTWSSPAISGGAIYLRTANHVYCIADPGNE